MENGEKNPKRSEDLTDEEHSEYVGSIANGIQVIAPEDMSFVLVGFTVNEKGGIKRMSWSMRMTEDDSTIVPKIFREIAKTLEERN
jgi:hypothetical protein